MGLEEPGREEVMDHRGCGLDQVATGQHLVHKAMECPDTLNNSVGSSPLLFSQGVSRNEASRPCPLGSHSNRETAALNTPPPTH
jgi:hypothetical protein